MYFTYPNKKIFFLAEGVRISEDALYICLWTKKKKLNRTLAIDSPFQTFAVGHLVEFIEQLVHFLLMHTISFYRRMT